MVGWSLWFFKPMRVAWIRDPCIFPEWATHRNEHTWTPSWSTPVFHPWMGFLSETLLEPPKAPEAILRKINISLRRGLQAAVIQNHVANEFEDLKGPLLASCRKFNHFIGEFSWGFLGLADFFGEYFPQASYRPILRLHGRIHYLIASGTKARFRRPVWMVFLEKASAWTGPHMHLAITVAHFSKSQNTQRFSEGFFFKHA